MGTAMHAAIQTSGCCQFSDIHISQGSVATYLRFGGIFKYEFVAYLSLSLLVKDDLQCFDAVGWASGRASGL